jgi:hypothetical protein
LGSYGPGAKGSNRGQEATWLVRSLLQAAAWSQEYRIPHSGYACGDKNSSHGMGAASDAPDGAASGSLTLRRSALCYSTPDLCGQRSGGLKPQTACALMDLRRRLEYQVRMVTATYRHERERGTPEMRRDLRARCLAILDGIADSAARYPDFMTALVAVRQELERDELLAANRLPEEPVHGLREPVD